MIDRIELPTLKMARYTSAIWLGGFAIILTVLYQTNEVFSLTRVIETFHIAWWLLPVLFLVGAALVALPSGLGMNLLGLFPLLIYAILSLLTSIRLENGTIVFETGILAFYYLLGLIMLSATLLIALYRMSDIYRRLTDAENKITDLQNGK